MSLIIFDMDGTVVDSSLTLARAINHVREKLGLTALDNMDILLRINDPQTDAPKYFYNCESFTKDHEKWFYEYYTENHEKELRLYDGIKELLEELKKEDFLLGLATNAYRRSTMESLKHLNIEKCFDSVICHDDVKEGKPNPEMLFCLMDEFEKNRKDTVFVGDGERDKLAAEAAGIKFIRVDWGFDKQEEGFNKVSELHEYLLKNISH